jgi:hypothetical protein
MTQETAVARSSIVAALSLSGMQLVAGDLRAIIAICEGYGHPCPRIVKRAQDALVRIEILEDSNGK